MVANGAKFNMGCRVYVATAWDLGQSAGAISVHCWGWVSVLSILNWERDATKKASDDLMTITM